MSDQLGPIERVTPPPPAPKVTRERSRDDQGGQRRQPRRQQPADEQPADDGLPHVDVRA